MEEGTGWYACNGGIIVMGLFGSMIQNGIFALVGTFPSRYVSGTMIGIGTSGIIFLVFRTILILFLRPDNTKGRDDMNSYYGTLIFFGASAVILVICIIAAVYVFNTTFAKFYLEKAQEGSHSSFITDNKTDDTGYSFISTSDLDKGEHINKSVLSKSQNGRSPKIDRKSNTLLNAYKELGSIPYQMSLSLVITFCMYPGCIYETHLKFLSGNKSEDTWFAIIIGLFYGTNDILGRYLAEKFKIFNSKTIGFVTFSRLIFMPLFIMIPVLESPSWLLGADYFKLIALSLFAVTGGYN